MAVRKGFIDTEKQKRDSSSVVHVYSDAHRDRFVCMSTVTCIGIGLYVCLDCF